MDRRRIRCFRAFAEAARVFNIQVLLPAGDGYRLELATCIRCGELFLVDRENPLIGSQSVDRLAEGSPCPKCGSNLGECLRDYPQTFLAGKGRLGSFTAPAWVPTEGESVLVDLWVIEPRKGQGPTKLPLHRS